MIKKVSSYYLERRAMWQKNRQPVSYSVKMWQFWQPGVSRKRLPGSANSNSPVLLPAYLLLFCFLVSGCGEQKLTPLTEQAVILAFGDSLTAGVGAGAGSENAYPAVLAQLSGRQVINAGVSGETSDAGLRRLPEVLAETGPELMVLLEGGNDILRNQRPAVIKRNLASMIELARAREVQVVLIGVPEKSLFSDSAGFYRELADEFDLVFDADLLAGLLRKPALKSDPIHLNEAGYREMAQAIHRLLLDNGAL